MSASPAILNGFDLVAAALVVVGLSGPAEAATLPERGGALRQG